uniref:Ionotropic glutamate receptor L-glutamate and glycine-binding domain-containing protein n=1 Tax=Bracon brevicornis TaxID=1563983 RepID=A0A6V7JZQ5_9HYME
MVNLDFPFQYLIILMCTKLMGINCEPEWFQDLFRYIGNKDASHREVIIITSRKAPNRPVDNPWVIRLLQRTTQIYPIIRINLNPPFDNHDESHFLSIDATAALFIFVHDILTERSIYPEKVIDIMKRLSLNKKHVRYLAIFLSLELTNNFDKLLKYSWSQQVMDFTIIEMIHCINRTEGLLKICTSNEESPVIHYYNPFLNETVTRTYQAPFDWFPDVLQNMHGYPLKIGVVNRPPFSYVEWHKNLTLKSMNGPDIKLIRAVAERMNFSLDILPRLITYSELYNERTPQGLFNLMASGKVDIYAAVTPHFSENISESLFRSEKILRDELCALVPITKTVAIPLSKDAIEAMVVIIGVVLIYVASSWFLHFYQSWDFFRTIRVLLGIPINVNNSHWSLTQRIVVQVLMIVSLFFSANIYGGLTKVSIDLDTEVQIKTFQELDESGLIPIINPFFFNKTFGNIDPDDKPMLNLKKKAITSIAPWRCPIEAGKYFNVTCLIGKREGELFIKSSYLNGKPTIKFAETCFWLDSYVFLIRPGSPYRRRMDNILTLFQEVGLREKWYRDGPKMMTRKTSDDESLDPPKGVLSEHLTAVSVFGCVTATAIFFCEIIWHRRAYLRILMRKYLRWWTKT